MQATYLVTEAGITHAIPLDGPVVYALSEGGVVIKYWTHRSKRFHPIEPDQPFLEIVRLREQARRVK